MRLQLEFCKGGIILPNLSSGSRAAMVEMSFKRPYANTLVPIIRVVGSNLHLQEVGLNGKSLGHGACSLKELQGLGLFTFSFCAPGSDTTMSFHIPFFMSAINHQPHHSPSQWG